MNALLPSATLPAAAGTPVRGDAPTGDERDAFAAVLGQRLRHAAHDQEHEAAPAMRALRSAARKPQDADGRESVEANALPLIAAALESRSLAPSQGEAPARSAAASGGLEGKAALGGAVRAGSPLPLPLPPIAPEGHAAAHAAPETTVVAEAGRDDVALQLRPQPQLPHEQGAMARRAAADASSAVPGDKAPSAAGPVRLAVPAANPPAAAALPIARAARDDAPARAEPGSRPVESPPARIASDPAARAPGEDIAAPRDSSQAPAARELPAAPGVVTLTGGPVPAAPVADLPATAPAGPVAGQGRVAPPLGHPAWGAALGQEVARLHHGGHGQAQLELNPPGLGPLSVSLSVADQQAHAVFVSPHPAVRAAVEAALPQLRSALADSGISLGQASVGAEHQPGSGAFSPPSQDGGAQRRAAAAAVATPQPPADVPAAAPRSSGHMLDTFA